MVPKHIQVDHHSTLIKEAHIPTDSIRSTLADHTAKLAPTCMASVCIQTFSLELNLWHQYLKVTFPVQSYRFKEEKHIQ